ncbi:NADPH2 dehydrogenase [Fusarium circinatum]|uniref:NADPH2 dehydrogenase n=1 Tax=Fusarium circinatum TaxID=48490 RepID=A0A8H5UDC6_FUSCI|nr:NADPH2 dehydrogenase [Fusarium circinatum]
MRLSLWSDFANNGMDNPTPTLTYIIQQLRTLKTRFLNLIEARFQGNDDADCGGDNDVSFAVNAWGKEAPVMSSQGFNGESAQTAVDEIFKDYKLAIVFGCHWTMPHMSHNLTTSDKLNDGNWVTSPLGVINPGDAPPSFEGTAGVQENGVDGSVVYASQIGLVTFIFNNPNSGLNTYSGTVKNPNYKISHSTGAGQAATVTYILESDPTR